ncbi:F-box/kelch-repeat protein At3g06240-like [Cornus florida]|uniref:F-box/kelch-repeat protein At3g06240-like n=1 Tax=Cornus florida TaxID=4283 RepID=UPI0028A29DBF|nr:F-box/kelch-repeat protein At3g06240-like [Cornus florida]
MKNAENTNHESCEEEVKPLPSLPEPILVEILSKLPVKSLLRFKCVSKSWRSLISDSPFMKKHLNQSLALTKSSFETQRLLIATIRPPYRLYTASFRSSMFEIDVEKIKFLFPNNPVHPRCSVVGSGNGLICMEVDFLSKPIEDFWFIYIFNPSTREFMQIPDREFPRNFGFGYDHCSDDCKLVKITDNSVYVYSVSVGSWRKVQDFPEYNDGLIASEPMVELNGVIHWISLLPKFEIVAFSLADEKLWMIAMPPCYTEFEAFRFTVFQGCLCVMPQGDHAYWIMKEYGVEESWTRIAGDEVPKSDVFAQLAVLNYGETMLLVDGNKSALYNTREDACSENIVIEGEEDLKLTIYVDSFTSPVIEHK